MSFKEEFIFWRLANLLISEHGYRMVQLFDNQKELWLEKIENRKAPIIRILLQSLDWSSRMQRDIYLTAANGEKIRKQVGRNKINVTNIYISPYPPVDDYEFRLKDPYVFPEGKKTTVITILMAMGTYEAAFHKLSERLEKEIAFAIEDDSTEEDVGKLKDAALQFTVEQRKSEKTIVKNRVPYFTYTFILMQIAVYLWLEMHGGSTNTSTLIKYGAKVNPLIYEGEWWRFITPVFIHIGFAHLALNSIFLYFFGSETEKLYGSARFFFIYLFSGVTGFIASFLFTYDLSAGASGAIFGCFGALLFFGAIYPKLFYRSSGQLVLFLVIINLVSDFFTTGIDTAGHIGGVIGGFLAAGMLQLPKKKNLWRQLLFCILSLAAVWGSLAYGFSESALAKDQSSSLIIAQNYIQKQQYSQAYSLLTDAEKKAKNPSVQLYFELSYIEMKKGMLPVAESHLLKVVKLQPDFDAACYNLALLYMQENNLQKAKYYAEMAVKLQPKQKEYTDLLTEITIHLQTSGGGG